MELNIIKQVDAEVAQYIEDELKRQQETIELIASENFVSKAVMAAAGTVLTNKYAEGKPHKRYYNGCEHIDKIEELAQKSSQPADCYRAADFSWRTGLRRGTD